MLYKGSYEDYIYILIGIIWIAYSIYKGVNKNKAARQKSAEGKPAKPKSKSFLETFLDEMTKQDTEPMEYIPPEKEIVTEPEVKTEKQEEEIFSYDNNYEKSNFDEASAVYEPEKMMSAKDTNMLKHSGKTKKTKTKGKIDMRKAVIYSEILNPRYF
ncbi:MAG: hypothetical protein GXO86_04935 [Chlorobi bacterium]|nr:hypothetical protein [Chlorobiota bacterium]